MFFKKTYKKIDLSEELINIATGPALKPLLNKAFELNKLSKSSLINLVDIMSKNKNVIAGNTALVNLMLFEKKAKKQELTEEEKGLFSNSFFILRSHLGLSKGESFIGIEVLIDQNTNTSLFLIYPDLLYKNIPAMFRESLSTAPVLPTIYKL